MVSSTVRASYRTEPPLTRVNSNIKIVVIRAPGYSGATWFNLLLGTNRDVLSLATAERIWKLPREQAMAACFEHEEQCRFWPKFVAEWDRGGNFFQQLSEYSNRHVFIVNYPSPELWASHIERSGFVIKHIKLIRDGRANLHSFLRHHYDGHKEALIWTITDWLGPKWDEIDRSVPKTESETMLQRYEDAVCEPTEALIKLGDFIGVDYGTKNKKYWEYEQHLTAGNTGVVDILRRLQGNDGLEHKRADYYAQATHRIRAEPTTQLLDESWIREFDRTDRLAFECLLGTRNEEYGYERDGFSSDEKASFSMALPALLEESRKWVERYKAGEPTAEKKGKRRFLKEILRLFSRHG